MPTFYRITAVTVIAGLTASLLPTVTVDAAALASAAPAATVARGQKEVVVLDVTLPAYSGDTVVDADGTISEDIGVPSVQAGGSLYPILSSARIAYGVGQQSDPQSVWIDRDGSMRYTPNFSADTKVLQPEVAGLPIPDGDVGASLKKEGLSNVKILVSDPAKSNTWHPEADGLYQDSGTVTNLVDSADVRLSASARFKQQTALSLGKAAIILRNASNTCPVGVATEDFIHIVGKPNIAVKEVVYEREPTSGACIAILSLYTASYAYAIDDQFGIVTPFIGDLDISGLKDTMDNGIPDAETTSITITAGTAKGIAAGDTIRIVRGAAQITFRVNELSSVAKVLKVTYLGGSLAGPPGDYLAAIAEHANYSGILTGILSALPAWVTYNDENGNGARDFAEPIYSDEDITKKVSKNDQRITGVTAERRLFKKQGAVDLLGGIYVDTATMAAPKWHSEKKPWFDGVDIVIDRDGDGFYSLDTLSQITVKNEGSATATDIDRVELWMEDNGMAGLQGTFKKEASDLRIESFIYDTTNRHWRIANLIQPLIAPERLYVTANIATNANEGTLRFAIPQNAVVTTHRTMPDAHTSNTNIQTISAAAVLPAEQQTPATGISAQNSIVRIVDRMTVPADGTSVATIEIEVRDVNNERLSNKTVQLERLRAGEDTILAVEQKVTNISGIASFPESSSEAGMFRFRGRVGSVLIGNAIVTYTPVDADNEVAGPANLVAGDLFMNKDAGAGGTVYYYTNGKKYPFPNERVYLSWYPNFGSVTIKKITPAEVGVIPWGTNVRYRPGTRMIKVPDDPKVYAVTPNGKVCWIKDEDIAKKFYGTHWNKKIDDLPASLFVGRTNYQHDPACDLTTNSFYPSGTLISVNDKPYYIDNGSARIISGEAWIGNRFREAFLIPVANLTGYALGAAIGNTEFSRVVN